MTIEPITMARQLAADLFDRIRENSADGAGVTRIAFGPGEIMAFREVAEAAASFGAEQAFDAAGNQFLTLAGADRSKRIVIGSHLDSVPHGGNYDGAAGVILGIALQKALVESGIVPPYDVTVACLRAEESCWFPHSYIGSKTALGRLEDGVLDKVCRSDTGKSLAAHMAENGFDPDAVRRNETFLDPQSIIAYIEPHIEQAPLLLNENIPVGIVTGIRGSFRYRQMQCFGEYSHSGAMPRIYRKDAAVASAKLITRMQSWWEKVEEEGGDLTVTFGQLGTDPASHSFSKVAGLVNLCLDVRSADAAMLERTDAYLQECISDIEKETGTRFELGPRTGSQPAVMNDRLIAFASKAAEECGLPARQMASGAGHDAATFALANIPSIMLFIRNSNGSHNPDEHMELGDFNAALDVAFKMLQSDKNQWS
nr:hydantoinase/carbamoylase family amidase [uncultured Cohaesibacter sp.]